MTKSIKTVEEFAAWTVALQGGMILYRGLADAGWEVESSAYRRIRESKHILSETVPAVTFQKYIDHLVDEAGLQGFRERQDRNLSDLELLAELQHFGAATCLIDFTTSALIALYFACWKETDKAGKVVAMSTDDVERFSSISYVDLKRPVREFLNKVKLWKWEPSGLNTRIVAQQSILVFGEERIEKGSYTGITIDAAHKNEIKETLRKSFGISERKLFKDLAGFAQINAHDQPYDRLTAEDFLYQGIALHQRGEYGPALVRFDRAIELQPKYSEAYYNRGNAKSALGNSQRAIDDYNRAIDYYKKTILFNRGYVDAYINRGNAKSSIGEQKEAIDDYILAIELDPRNGRAYSNRGHAKNESGDHKGAIDDCEKAIKLNPKDAFPYNNRGDAKRALGDHRGAIDDYDKAIELNPEFADAYYNRGISRRSISDEAGAKKDFARASKIDPSFQPPES